ncbi:MAG: S8 family serine peptidase [Hyphomicrobiaceae bacterium]|nr:S8 family serine peptidase [Hyphomicrobiaceae bacterium]
MRLLLLILSVLLAITAARASDEPPRVPPGRHPGGVIVALFDTGVNYTLPEIAARLARDGEGDLVGWDFETNSLRPFDRRPGDPRPKPQRHGTTVASIVIREAPAASLMPLRYRANDPMSFARMVGFVAQSPARIVAMPLGGPRKDDWEPFRRAALLARNVLFIVSAGNDGRDIDAQPIYPAGFGLPNVLVVAATDAFGRFTPEANWGAKTVDIATPAERIEALTFEGARTQASGSSFAVPRIAALAARLLAAEPKLDAVALKARIISFAGANPGERTPRTRHGWIPDPSRPARP